MLMGVEFYKAILSLHRDAFKFSMQTNLTLLTERWADFIADELNGKISTSFDVARSLRPVDATLWKENVALLRKRDVYPYVVSMLWRGNQHSADAIYDYFSALELSFRINPVERIGYANPSFDSLRHTPLAYAQAVNALFDRWFLNPATNIIVDPCAEILTFFILGNSFRKCPFTAKCALHFISINPDGSVYPCGGFETHPDFAYGNILTMTLTQLMQSPAQLRAARRNTMLPGNCAACRYLPLCNGGCRLEAYSYFGDLYRETSLCHEYREIFSHIERRLENEKGDVLDWWLSLQERRVLANCLP